MSGPRVSVTMHAIRRHAERILGHAVSVDAPTDREAIERLKSVGVDLTSIARELGEIGLTGFGTGSRAVCYGCRGHRLVITHDEVALTVRPKRQHRYVGDGSRSQNRRAA